MHNFAYIFYNVFLFIFNLSIRKIFNQVFIKYYNSKLLDQF